YAQQLEAYRVMEEDELFQVQKVVVTIPTRDMPGRPQRRVQCENCKEWVQDGRDINQTEKTLCRNCAQGAYFTLR
ncbi:MAG: formylmethanofuran dehydrogenase, partial [Desulfobulbaceae bacterium]|nr:formylmethanofuran dehydrogenase [Desulfobulbaceae bacterium]